MVQSLKSFTIDTPPSARFLKLKVPQLLKLQGAGESICKFCTSLKMTWKFRLKFLQNAKILCRLKRGKGICKGLGKGHLY